MDHSRGGQPVRRTREERRSLSESLADGTSKFFTSMVAKKNGLFSDLSSKIENTFAPKTDTISNSTGSDKSVSPPGTPPVPNTPPPRPPPPKRLPSMGSSRDGMSRETGMLKRMTSMPTYTRTDSRPDYGVPDTSNRRDTSFKTDSTTRADLSQGTDSNRAGEGTAPHKADAIRAAGGGDESRFSVNGMNISFDEPIYTKREADTGRAADPSNTRARPVAQPRAAPRTQKPEKVSPSNLPGADYGQGYVTHTATQDFDNRKSRPAQPPKRTSPDGGAQRGKTPPNGRTPEKYSSSPEERAKTSSSESGGSGNESSTPARPRAPMFTTTKRRSSTVDEMLFDDYVEPEVDVLVPAEPPENLICFEPSSPAGSSPPTSPGHAQTSADSSDGEFGGTRLHRSGSQGSDRSWSSTYSLDSQPDDVTLECMEFMKAFVDKVFHLEEEISQTEKAKFGELCQYCPGRLWFSRYVNSQRVHNKQVGEATFFRLMQYFAVCLFECNEAEDFSPAKTLMNMCFTFYYEAASPQGTPTKVFLFTYMREQPIWQSLRFWNAAFFDAVQNERSRRPMPTNSDVKETMTDDRQFQENITFGQLGTFACNMRSFGLSKELCLEFLRKQSTIANLRKDQVRLLRENMDKVKET